MWHPSYENQVGNSVPLVQLFADNSFIVDNSVFSFEIDGYGKIVNVQTLNEAI